MAVLSVELAGMKLRNPTILASGILGTSSLVLQRVVKSGAGAVTTKSISVEPRKGHNAPIIAEFECGLLNAVGYANPGIEKAIEEFATWKMRKKAPLILSIVGKDEAEFALLAEKSNAIDCDAVELALSCPHTPGYGLLAGQGTPEATEKITRAVKAKTSKPIIVKISPSVPAIGEIAKAAERAGAAVINMGNTAGPGMKINLERKKPILHFRFGGMSGPAIKPLAVRCVFDIYETVKIPIIGTGGITTGEDAIEMFMAGASAVGIGTAVYYRGINCFKKITKEMEVWLEKHGYSSINDIKGGAHEI